MLIRYLHLCADGVETPGESTEALHLPSQNGKAGISDATGTSLFSILKLESESDTNVKANLLLRQRLQQGW